MEHKHYGEEAKKQAGETLEQARSHTAEMVRTATESGSSFVENQRRLAAAEVDGYACALHETARQLHEQSQDRVAEYTERLADNLDAFARNLRERDIRYSFDRISEYARRQPMLFLGGAVAAGFAFTRFLKSSGREDHEPSSMREQASELKEKVTGGVEAAKEAAKEKTAEAREKTGEAVHHEKKTKAHKSTAAEAEIPVILKPHEPEHPGGPAPKS